ncbi:hypothetical protein [Chryseobacterium sp. CH25]|uniref:hypothetical protein n=1 Tax=Chryseobacterium sp. CH25 TaxID=713559 RepID=UPI00100A79D2|nr:hypothetical protein [Chryseobacterium sp. CH25]
MIRKSIVLILVFAMILFKAQTKKINILIMIDEKPCLIANNMLISSQSIDLIDVDYIVGTINLSDDNYDKLINNKSSSFNIGFEAILPKFTFAQKYLISIPKEFLNQKYIIINIFNINNKIYKKIFKTD